MMKTSAASIGRFWWLQIETILMEKNFKAAVYY